LSCKPFDERRLTQGWFHKKGGEDNHANERDLAKEDVDSVFVCSDDYEEAS